MMRNVLGYCVGIICFLNIWGCANSQPTHFYLLRTTDMSSSLNSSEIGESGLSLGLGPIRVPKYLDRPQIVTRISSHEIDLAEFHKWAAPLKDNIGHVLQENLSMFLTTDGIVSYPWNRSSSPDYQLSLDIIQFDGTKNLEAVFKVRWTLARGDETHVVHKKTSQFSEVPRGGDYEDLVEAMSRMLTTFSQEIADVLNSSSSSTHKRPKPKIEEMNPFQ